MLPVTLKYLHVCLFYRHKLESSIDQWQAYDKEYDTLSQWLKDTEGRVRNEATLKPDLPSKIEQYEQFKVTLYYTICVSFAYDCINFLPRFKRKYKLGKNLNNSYISRYYSHIE